MAVDGCQSCVVTSRSQVEIALDVHTFGDEDLEFLL